MATEVPSLFTKYTFDTEEEELSSVAFSLSQRQMMQSLICDAAEEKVRLMYDPHNPSSFLQREAELQGQIGILTILLNRYDELVEEIKARQLNT